MYEDPQNTEGSADESPVPPSRANGMSYRSPTEDNRRTTQQVLVARRSGIHAVMQPGPRMGMIVAVVIAVILYLATVIAPPSADTTDAYDSGTLLPTLTGVSPYSGERQVVVSGTGDSGLYLRSAPYRDAAIRGTIPDGTTLNVVGSLVIEDGNWLPVRMLDGTTGWVAAAYTREK